MIVFIFQFYDSDLPDNEEYEVYEHPLYQHIKEIRHFTTEQIDMHLIQPLIINIENPEVVEDILCIFRNLGIIPSDGNLSNFYSGTLLSQYLSVILIKYSQNEIIVAYCLHLISSFCLLDKYDESREFYASNKELCCLLVNLYEKNRYPYHYVHSAIQVIADGKSNDEKFILVFHDLMKPETFTKLFEVDKKDTETNVNV